MVNLLIELKLAGESCQVRTAARIKLDGKGGLTIVDAATSAVETISMADIESIRITAHHTVDLRVNVMAG